MSEASDQFVWPDLKDKIPHIRHTLKQALSNAEEEGHQAGFQRGLVDGREEAEQAMAELKARFAAAVEDLRSAKLSLEAEQVRTLADTLHALCTRILGFELTTTPQTLERVLAHAVESLSAEPGRLELCVNPTDEQWLVEHDLGARVIADSAVAEGSVVVQTLERSDEYKPLAVLDAAFAAIRDDLDGD